MPRNPMNPHQYRHVSAAFQAVMLARALSTEPLVRDALVRAIAHIEAVHPGVTAYRKPTLPPTDIGGAAVSKTETVAPAPEAGNEQPPLPL